MGPYRLYAVYEPPEDSESLVISTERYKAFSTLGTYPHPPTPPQVYEVCAQDKRCIVPHEEGLIWHGAGVFCLTVGLEFVK